MEAVLVRTYYTIKEMPNTKFGGVIEACDFMRLLGGESYSKIMVYSNGKETKATFYV